MVEFGRVPEKGRIRASIKKLFGRVLEKGRISVSTEKWYNPGKYPEKGHFVRVSKTCPGEYRNKVESM